jgi:hypothetical protein
MGVGSLACCKCSYSTQLNVRGIVVLCRFSKGERRRLGWRVLIACHYSSHPPARRLALRTAPPPSSLSAAAVGVSLWPSTACMLCTPSDLPHRTASAAHYSTASTPQWTPPALDTTEFCVSPVCIPRPQCCIT